MKSRIKTYLFILTTFHFLITASCKKKDEMASPTQETGIYTDTINQVTYKTIKIGDQWWMAENLKGTKYRNGVYITKIQFDSTQWRNDTVGAYCIYETPLPPPGLLYNWYAVNNINGLAPAGWHVPSDEEWKTLEMHLGMSRTDADQLNWRGSNEADKLKIKSYENWAQVSSIFSTNESGFSALAGSCRLFNAKWGFLGLGVTGYWWTTMTNKDDQPYYRYLDYKKTQVFRNCVPKNYGFSVRCVKD